MQRKQLIIIFIVCLCISASAGAGYAFRCDLGFEDCSEEGTPATPAGTPATPAGTPPTPAGTPPTPAGTPPTPAGTPCTATVYKDANYSGELKEITTNLPSMSDADFGNDNISSIKLSGDCGIVKLHENENYEGKFSEVWEDIPDLDKYGFKDKTSSISFGGKNNCRVQLFQHGDYDGDIRNMTESISSLGNSLGFNDKISSMKVGSGCGTVTVYKDSQYTKDPRVVTGDIPSVRTVAYNDGISSIKIE